jgi:hypothetical protein
MLRFRGGIGVLLVGIVASGLIALAVGAVAYLQYRTMAQRWDGQRLSFAAQLGQISIEQRVQRLRQQSQELAEDPAVVSYIAQAIASSSASGMPIDIASISDLIGARVRKAKLDFAAVLDDHRRWLTTQGDRLDDSASLAQLAVVDEAERSRAARSTIERITNHTYLISAVPMQSGQRLVAWLVTGLRLEYTDLRSMADAAHAELALLRVKPGGAVVLAASLPAATTEALQRAAGRAGSTWRSSPAMGFDLALDGRPHRGFWLPLPASGDALGLLSLIPVTTDSAMVDALTRPLVLFVLGAWVTVGLLLCWLWLRAVRPLTHLAALAERALAGDHALNFTVKAMPTIARIADGLNWFSTRLERYRVLPGSPRRRATDVDFPSPTRRIGP